ncbi:MAG: serine/threonine protein kinase [Thermoleophilia bacterium]|nr:serine/threonine protein kinase [Thermoleophilia bacterium]
MGQAAALAHSEGLILGRYRALRPLGSGGHGSVWLARDERDGREVALKIVPREGKAGVRAEREALAVARLRSRYCARVYAVERDDRHVYVAYEYLPGKTLREAARAGELDDAAAVEAAAQLLDALAHAHHRGIVHRDVKPANVLLVAGPGISLRLLDFGLAQLGDADALTATGDVPGTLAYIAPERLSGEQATGAADVWAAAVILWELLAGYQPFWSGSPVETARLIAAGPPPLAKVRPDLPRRLAVAVDRAVSVDPRRRPDPRRLAAEIRASLEERAERRSRRPAVSRRVVLERAPHAALAAAAIAGLATWFPFYPPGSSLPLAVVTALACLALPRAGLIAALALALLPLGDVSLGLAVVYAAVALGWLALCWHDARRGLLFVAGPLLALVGLLPLVALPAAWASGAARRAAQCGGAVLAAALVAGLRGAPLPFTGEPPPLGLGIAGSDSPVAVAGALWRALAAQPAIGIEAALLAAAAAALPLVRRHGLAGAAALACLLPGALLLGPPLLGAGRVAAPALLGGAALLVAVVAAPAATAWLRAGAGRAPRLQ